VKEPLAHAFYVVSPVAFIYAFHCWARVDSPRRRRLAAGVLLAGVLWQTGLAAARAPERSLYKNRAVVTAAIRQRCAEILGHRRPFAVDATPTRPETPALAAARAERDLRVTAAQWSRATGGVAVWMVTVENDSPAAAYRDFRYLTTYRDQARTAVVDSGHGMLPEVLQP